MTELIVIMGLFMFPAGLGWLAQRGKQSDKCQSKD